MVSSVQVGSRSHTRKNSENPVVGCEAVLHAYVKYGKTKSQLVWSDAIYMESTSAKVWLNPLVMPLVCG